MTCKKAQGFLGPAGTEVRETVDASKVRISPDDALALLDGIDLLIAMKGARIERFDLRKESPDDATLLSKLIGPSGNLRAPTARVGKTLLVGFNEEAYQQTLGG
jgi:arsenate reductase-like glutaredoxin family protein